MAQGTLWFAQWAVKNGLSANAGLRIAQSEGFGIRRETWLKMYGEAKNRAAVRSIALGEILTQVPGRSDINPVPTRNQTGYVQYADVYLRSKDTGDLYVRTQAIRTRTLLSRDQVVEAIWGRYTAAVENAKAGQARWGTMPDEVVEGVWYTDTVELYVSADT